MTILLESAIRVTLIAGIIALVLFAMRIKRASVLHAAWAGVVVLMLLLPAWVAWGPKASLPILPPYRAPVIALSPQPLPAGLVSTTPASPVSNPVPSPARQGAGYVAIYLLGVGVLLLRLAIGTVRANRLTSASCVVPVTVGLLHPRIILPDGSREWPSAQLDAVMAHEGEHIRRRDPLFQWLALLNRALFWFHPLAWWLERKLSGLAEEACDAAVIAHGHDPREYSEYLLDLARSAQRAGARIEAVGMAMPGIGLKHRIRRILSGVPVPRISRPRMACTVAVCAAAAAILAAGTLVRAQSPAPKFEVASVKPHIRASGFIPLGCSNGRLTSTGWPLVYVIEWAYDLNTDQDRQVEEHLPKWLSPTAAYDIEAKSERPVTESQCRLMTQTLLADRFKFTAHWVQKEVQVSDLVVARGGPKLEKAVDIDEGRGVNISLNGRPFLSAPGATKDPKGMTMQQFAVFLTSFRRLAPILDKTGLEGMYKINLKFSIQPMGGNQVFEDPDLETALQQQLGLKLEKNRKGSMNLLILDHIEPPSEN